MIIHIPHNSRLIPDKYINKFVLGKNGLEHEKNVMTDSFTDELFEYESVVDSPIRIVFPVSRLLVDPERFADDALEPMSRKGMGVLYIKTHQGKTLRLVPNKDERDELLDAFYYPHQKKVSDAVKDELSEKGKSLVIDAHSFPSRPLPCDIDQGADRPDFCLGTDSFHTPDDLTDALERRIKRLGYTVEINKPYGGAFVPSDYYGKEKSVFSVMIEVNRKLYMNESTAEKLACFSKVKEQINQLLQQAETKVSRANKKVFMSRLLSDVRKNKNSD